MNICTVDVAKVRVLMRDVHDPLLLLNVAVNVLAVCISQSDGQLTAKDVMDLLEAVQDKQTVTDAAATRRQKMTLDEVLHKLGEPQPMVLKHHARCCKAKQAKGNVYACKVLAVAVAFLMRCKDYRIVHLLWHVAPWQSNTAAGDR